MAKATLVAKAYIVYVDNHKMIFYGKNASQARYQYYKGISEFEEISLTEIKESFNRSPSDDLYQFPLHPLIRTLSCEEVKVIKHSYGASNKAPGSRTHFYCSRKDPILTRLVKLGVFESRNQSWPNDMQFFNLTALGKDVARSMFPQKNSE